MLAAAAKFPDPENVQWIISYAYATRRVESVGLGQAVLEPDPDLKPLRSSTSEKIRKRRPRT